MVPSPTRHMYFLLYEDFDEYDFVKKLPRYVVEGESPRAISSFVLPMHSNRAHVAGVCEVKSSTCLSWIHSMHF